MKTEKYRENTMMEAEIGVTQGQAKEHLGLPVTPEVKRKARNRFSPTAFKTAWP